MPMFQKPRLALCISLVAMCYPCLAPGSVVTWELADEVIGSGTWKLENNGDAQIVIDATCPCLTGNVQIYAGKLDVNQTFRTSGQLSLAGRYTEINVAGGKTARFSAPNDCLE